MFTILYLSGGGVRAFAQLGCLYILQRHNALQRLQHVGGTSIGALLSLAIVAQVPIDRLIQWVETQFVLPPDVDLSTMLQDEPLMDLNPLLDRFDRFLETYGVCLDWTLQTLSENVTMTWNVAITDVSSWPPSLKWLSQRTTPQVTLRQALTYAMSIIGFTSCASASYLDGAYRCNYSLESFLHHLDYPTSNPSDIVGINTVSNRPTQDSSLSIKTLTFIIQLLLYRDMTPLEASVSIVVECCGHSLDWTISRERQFTMFINGMSRTAAWLENEFDVDCADDYKTIQNISTRKQ